MMKILVVCATAAVLFTAAPAQDLPKLSEFLSSCFRDSTTCRGKLRDYVNAADTQKIICRPEDVSVNEATGDLLRWLRSDNADALKDGPYDDALFVAATTLYPCKQEVPPPPPPPAPADQPAAPADQPAAPADQPAAPAP